MASSKTATIALAGIPITEIEPNEDGSYTLPEPFLAHISAETGIPVDRVEPAFQTLVLAGLVTMTDSDGNPVSL